MKFSHLISASALTLTLTSYPCLSQAETLHDRQLTARPQVELASKTAAFKPGINRVTFQSEGETLVGNLHLPASYKPGDKLPVVVVTGAWITIKEQMAGLYAQQLADRGYAAFAFDFRSFGESGGKLRHFESPTAKITDIKNAVSFLQTVDAVDGDRIAGLGICASAGYMTTAAAQDDRIKALITVAPWIHDPAIVNAVYGGEAAVKERVAIGRAAATKFAQTGQPDYVLATSKTDKTAVMYGDLDYYQNPQRGAIPQWQNKFAVASWAEWLTFNPMSDAKNIKVPTLFVHSEVAAIPHGAKQFFAAIPTNNKQFAWLPNTTQFDFYDRQPTVSRVVSLVQTHLNTSL
jgi:uncharacterized protein